MAGRVITELLDLAAAGADHYTGPSNGPVGKRAYGGLLAAQSLAAACRTVDPDRRPTALHVQFLRGGDAGTPVDYSVERVHDGRSSASRRVLGRQGDRLMTSATVLFAVPAAGPSHAERLAAPGDPEALERTGPIGPAPALPLGEIDIRVADAREPEFVRRMWWRVTVPLPDDPALHACVALFITDIYGIDPVLAVHGHSQTDRSHHAGTTDSSTWFHDRVHADRWNLLESRSPAAGRGRGLMTAGLFCDGVRVATMVHEGQVMTRVADGKP